MLDVSDGGVRFDEGGAENDTLEEDGEQHATEGLGYAREGEEGGRRSVRASRSRHHPIGVGLPRLEEASDVQQPARQGGKGSA